MRTIQSKAILVLLLLAGLLVSAESLFAQQRVLLLNMTNTNWRWHSNNVDPAYAPVDAWVQPGFNDSTWSGPGAGLFGFESTPAVYLPYTFPPGSLIPPPNQSGGAIVSSYFRTHFNWTNLTQAVPLSFTNFVDDGMVVYLNGVELWSYNMPARPVAWNNSTMPNGANPAPTPEGTPWVTNITANLNAGDNVIAVQLNQQGTGSSDDVFGMWLWGTVPQPVVITSHPQSQTVVQCRPVTFAVTAGGSSPTYQWTKDNVDIPDATNRTYSIDPVSLSDAAVYRVRVTNPYNSLTSNPATLTVTPDNTAPVIVSASSVLATEVSVLFDGRMDPATAGDAINYSIPGGPTVTNVVVQPGGAGVRLQLDGPVTSPFTVNVNEAHDCAGNTIASGATVSGSQWADSGDIGSPTPAGNAFSPSNGYIDVTAGGADIWGNADQFHFVYNQRSGDFDVKVKVQRLDTANSWSKGGLLAREALDGPSATIEAYSTPDNPPGTHTYEAGRRNVSGAATLDWGGRPASPIPNAWVRLRRNGDTWRAYWGTNGTDWTIYAGPVVQPMIADLYVGPASTSHNVNQTTFAEFRNFGNFTYPGAGLTFNPQPASRTVQQHEAVTFTATAVASGAPQSEIHYQWQRSDDGVTWNNIPGANGTSYSIAFPEASDAGDRFRLVASIPGATLNSAPATLTLTPDTRRPHIRSVIGVNATKLIVFFDEPMAASAGDPFSYELDQGITVGDAVLDPNDPMRVNIDISSGGPTLTPGTTYTLTAHGDFATIVDTSGNVITPDPTTATFVAINFPGDPNTVQFLPTNAKRALGSLTTRGFKGRYAQAGAAAVNDLAVTEQMLAGTYINTATGQPYPNIAPVTNFVETGTINYNNNGTVLTTDHFRPDRQYPGYSGPVDMFCFELLTYVELRAGIYHMGVNSDDGFRVTPATDVSDPNNSTVLGFFNGGRGSADTFFDFIVTEDGLYPMRLIWEEGGGDANVEWFIQDLADNSGTPVYIAINDDRVKAFQPPVTTIPRITLTRGATTITLSWTDPGGTYQLQSSPSLAPANWTNLSGASGVGGNYSITITPASTGARYYRLRSP